MTRIRLEVLEGILLQQAELAVPSAAGALGPSHLKRLKNLSDDVEKALNARGGGAYEAVLSSFKRRAAAGAGKGGCAPPTGGNLELRKVRATLGYVDLVQRNNALDIVGGRPEYGLEYRSDTAFMDWLSESATLMRDFDPQCAKEFDAPVLDPDRTKAFMLDSAAKYWEARAGRFGFPEDQDNEAPLSKTEHETAADLCKAKLAYRDALRLFAKSFRKPKEPSLSSDPRPAPPKFDPLYARLDDGSPTMDRELRYADDTQTVTRLRQAIRRVNDLLSAYPAGELTTISTKLYPGCDDFPSPPNEAPAKPAAAEPGSDQ